ncbi:(Fe-S)-binding protein [uncultured Desulfuromusa sp.]|uniref:(Fe-S)-binding protein n=1 Tax=uncultured Desulfuromusa sp. TaxID=219183 RepID=UPI002AA67610|nr:(Fe-S)-binding protein [uncultured Desulfuromusa sp.]
MKVSNFRTEQTLKKFTEKCVSCRLCFKECEVLSGLNLSPATIAETLLTRDQFSIDFIEAIQKCSLCGLCSHNCPLGLYPNELMMAARELLVSGQTVDSDDYRVLQVDHEHHIFSLYRKTWQIEYKKLHRKQSPVLFFPGCTLSSYAPRLTRTAYYWLQQQGMDIGLNEQCCGLPLESIGLFDRHLKYINRLEKEFSDAGVKQIVTACPNCFYHLQGKFAGIEVLSLYQLLVDAGIRVAAMDGPVTIHDSCPDRLSGQIGCSVRTLLDKNIQVEMIHHKESTICCGAGGLVSMVDPQLSNQRAATRLEEFQQSSTNYCVSACMGCVKRLESVHKELSADKSDNEKPLSQLQIIHILELVFNLRINHEELQQQLELMWQGEQGEQNIQLLTEDTEIQTVT